MSACMCGAVDCAQCYPNLQKYIDVDCGCIQAKACYTSECCYCGSTVCDNCDDCERCRRIVAEIKERNPNATDQYIKGWMDCEKARGE